MQDRKQKLERDMEQRTGSRLGKTYVKAVYCHPAYLNYVQSTSCEMLGNAGLHESQAEIKIARRNNNLRYADDTTLNSRKQRGTKEPLNEDEKKRVKKLA